MNVQHIGCVSFGSWFLTLVAASKFLSLSWSSTGRRLRIFGQPLRDLCVAHYTRCSGRSRLNLSTSMGHCCRRSFIVTFSHNPITLLIKSVPQVLPEVLDIILLLLNSI